MKLTYQFDNETVTSLPFRPKPKTWSAQHRGLRQEMSMREPQSLSQSGVTTVCPLPRWILPLCTPPSWWHTTCVIHHCSGLYVYFLHPSVYLSVFSSSSFFHPSVYLNTNTVVSLPHNVELCGFWKVKDAFSYKNYEVMNRIPFCLLTWCRKHRNCCSGFSEQLNSLSFSPETWHLIVGICIMFDCITYHSDFVRFDYFWCSTLSPPQHEHHQERRADPRPVHQDSIRQLLL